MKKPRSIKNEKVPVTIRLDADIIDWAKKKGENIGLKYQTVINMEMRKAAGLTKQSLKRG